MSPHFAIAAGSVLGRNHALNGHNNQDAFAWMNQNGIAIAIVCDGCGSASSSEVGAKVGARLVLEVIWQRLQFPESRLDDPEFWPTVQAQILDKLGAIASTFDASLEEIINTYLLFTIMGVVVTPDLTTIFGVGDGILALNDEVVAIGPFADNAPPYLAYLLAEEIPNLPSDFCDIKVYRQVPTVTVESVLIGSDGVADWGAIATQPLPGKTELVGPLSQFWQGDRFFTNPDRVRRRLALINRESVKANWSQQWLEKAGGLLPDDTTLVVMRRLTDDMSE